MFNLYRKSKHISSQLKIALANYLQKLENIDTTFNSNNDYNWAKENIAQKLLSDFILQYPNFSNITLDDFRYVIIRHRKNSRIKHKKYRKNINKLEINTIDILSKNKLFNCIRHIFEELQYSSSDLWYVYESNRNIIFQLVSRLLDFKVTDNMIIEACLQIRKAGLNKTHSIKNNSCNNNEPISIHDLSIDKRKKVYTLQTRRIGARLFRTTILNKYNNRCIISKIVTQQSIDIAHIIPYLGLQSNHQSNGLPIRKDIHPLFDNGLIILQPKDNDLVVINVSSQIKDSDYLQYHNMVIKISDKQTIQLLTKKNNSF